MYYICELAKLNRTLIYSRDGHFPWVTRPDPTENMSTAYDQTPPDRVRQSNIETIQTRYRPSAKSVSDRFVKYG